MFDTHGNASILQNILIYNINHSWNHTTHHHFFYFVTLVISFIQTLHNCSSNSRFTKSKITRAKLFRSIWGRKFNLGTFSPINNDLHLVINPNLWFSVIISHLYFVGNQQKCRLYWYYYCYCYQKYLRYQPFCSILHQVSYKNRLLLKIFVIDSYYLST